MLDKLVREDGLRVEVRIGMVAFEDHPSGVIELELHIRVW